MSSKSQGIIIFYHGLKDFGRGRDSHLMIDNIISEEERHIHLLTDTLEQMRLAPDDFDTITSVAALGARGTQDPRTHLAQN